MLRARRTWLVLGTLFLGLTFPAAAETYIDEDAQLIVSVYNDAGVSSAELAEAEKEAARIFGHAGIDLVWAAVVLRDTRRPGHPRPGGRGKLARFGVARSSVTQNCRASPD